MQRLLPPAKTAGKTAGRTKHGQFTRGNSGGKKGRSGRVPRDFTKLCQSLVDKYELVDRVALMAGGKPIIQFDAVDPDTGQPETVFAPARATDQLAAAKLLLSYAHGQPPEHVIHEGEITQYVVRTGRMPATLDEWRKTFSPSRS